MRSDGLKEDFALDVRFHEYKGLKRVLSIIIVRKSGGEGRMKIERNWRTKKKKKKEKRGG